MTDLSKRQYPGQIATLQNDLQRALGTLRRDVNSAGDYSPANPEDDWAGTPPSSIAEALDRLAFHIRSNGNGGGTNTPIVELV